MARTGAVLRNVRDSAAIFVGDLSASSSASSTVLAGDLGSF